MYFNYRPEPIQTREEPTRTRTKNLQVLIESKCLGPKDPDLKRTGPNPTRRPERRDLAMDMVLEHLQ